MQESIYQPLYLFVFGSFSADVWDNLREEFRFQEHYVSHILSFVSIFKSLSLRVIDDYWHHKRLMASGGGR